jgi:death-on-curing protein
MADDVLYLTIDQVKRFHALVLELGGSDGIRSEQMLASSVFQPQQSAFGEDAYPTVPEKAAAYAFLDLNCYDFSDDEHAIEDMFVAVAAGTVDQSEFFGWVVNHCRRGAPKNA